VLRLDGIDEHNPLLASKGGAVHGELVGHLEDP
jgi:hypothetical protein